jgi:hypothetical protein
LIKGEDGNYENTVNVARLPIPVQRKIVMTAAAMLGSPELESSPDNEDEITMLEAVKETWTANKLDYKFTAIAKIVMSERACAELWYTKDVEEAYAEGYPLDSSLRLSMKILSRSKGDSLYPVFDEYDNMIAFGRGYRVLNEDAVYINHFDVYTADKIYYSKQQNSVWLWGIVGPAGLEYQTDFTGIDNIIGKIPVVYYWQPLAEWQDVQPLINRLEVKLSNLADTNDYFDSPILLASGETISFSKKGESGKLLELKNGADAKYLTWDQMPAAMKMEIDELKESIYSYTHTPDISFEKLTGLGYFSQVALKTLFSDAHFKAQDKEEIFGEGIQRRINFLKKAISVLDKSYAAGLSLDIKPKFNFYVPKNTTEEVDRLVTAVDAGILSTETAVSLNPLVGDIEVEQQRIKDEAAKAAALTPPVTGSPVFAKAPSTAQANN